MYEKTGPDGRRVQGRAELEAKQENLTAQINGRELSQVDAEGNVRALEQRMLQYLTDLHIPDLGQELSVHINRVTYMPEISGHTFDELSSQGLKTLVNIAHAFAHHTVTIDRDLPMPGLLVLDGISANAGHEGFDQEHVRDVYRLIDIVARQYRNRLQNHRRGQRNRPQSPAGVRPTRRTNSDSGRPPHPYSKGGAG